MRFGRYLPVFLLAAGVAACDSDSKNPVRTAFAQRPPTRVAAPVAFRFPDKVGGGVRVYRLPRLEEVTFRFNTPGLAAARVLGYSEEDDQIYLVSPRGTLEGLDLGTGRSRRVDTSVAAAVAGPTGIPYVIHTDGSIAVIEHRVPVRWEAKLGEQPTSLVGAGRGTLIVEMRSPGKRQLLTLSANRPTVTQAVPEGPMVSSLWGDAVVIGTDSGLAVVNPAKAGPPVFTALKQRPAAIGLSPSAHRLYAAEGTELAIVDGFSRRVLSRETMPGAISAIRVDPFGRYLLLRPVAGDSLWIFDLATTRYAATIRSSWDNDLPTAAADGSILTRLGADVTALAADSLTTVGRVRGSAADRWMGLDWDPRRPALQLAEEAEQSSVAVSGGEVLYVQVSVSQNESWAQDLADNLKRSGLSASVLPPPPQAPDDGYKVVLGPYPTREAAEDAGRKLGKSFWVFARTPETANP